jgi:ferritin-like metal-binding protein YciE
MALKTLQDLLVDTIKDIYDAEHQIMDTLPKMADLAKSQELKNAFQEHLQQTRGQARRLEEVFRACGEEPRRKSCAGMEGIIDEGEVIGKEFEENSALDAALIDAAQKVEHYEIASYGTLCAWAEELENPRALSLLKQNLSEEKETDVKLTELAETSRNLFARQHDTKKKGEFAAKVSSMVS